MADYAPVGELIAVQRRRRGLSQVQLAGLIGRSESWLSQVERGVRRIDRISVLVQIADVLKVPVAELTAGAPIMQEPGEQHPAIDALRLTLSGQESLALMFQTGGSLGDDLPSLDELRAQVDSAWQLAHTSNYDDLGLLLVELIPRLEVTARRHRGPEGAAAFELLALAYQAATELLAKVGEAGAAWVAADRAMSAAERAGVPILAAVSAFRLTHAFVNGRRLDQAQHVATRAVRVLEDHVEDGPPELVSVFGALHLMAAHIAARRNDADTARTHMGTARLAAQQLGQDRNDFHTEFGPTNVALQDVAIAVELGDAGEALRKAATIDVSALSPERRGRFLIAVARAYAQRRRTDDAVRSLREAEAVTPQQVQDHELVREMVRELLRAERRRSNPELRALAQRVGVL